MSFFASNSFYRGRSTPFRCSLGLSLQHYWGNAWSVRRLYHRTLSWEGFCSPSNWYRLSKYDNKIAENGLAVTLYLRLVFFPLYADEFRYGIDTSVLHSVFLGHSFRHSCRWICYDILFCHHG